MIIVLPQRRRRSSGTPPPDVLNYISVSVFGFFLFFGFGLGFGLAFFFSHVGVVDRLGVAPRSELVNDVVAVVDFRNARALGRVLTVQFIVPA
ncbi:MAG: hypothetical protein IIZ35_00285, partial [Clostridia bacterium]|nr:hypothetical protein [Clostridia bacterium]